MRLLFVVQRYGERVLGGAEHLTRQLAERLAGRGHQVQVITSTAESHADWSNTYPAGSTDHGGVLVHRLGVAEPRDNRLFGGVDQRVRTAVRGRVAPALADRWAAMVGPDLPDLPAALQRIVPDVDVTVVSGYMFSTSVIGVPTAAALGPVLLQPVIHDEPYVRLPFVRQIFDHADAVCALTDEEADLIRLRFRPPGPVEVVGAGVELRDHGLPAEREVRDRFGIGDAPYLVCVGRIEAGKGTLDLVADVARYLSERPGDLKLVLVGSGSVPLEVADHLVVTGFVDDATKAALLRAALALVQPSYFESFSISLVEGWLAGLPALVQRWCSVLDGQVRRSGGGLAYHGYDEFEAAVDLLREDPLLRRRLAQGGARYAANYDWDNVLERFEHLLRATVDARSAGSGSVGSGRWR